MSEEKKSRRQRLMGVYGPALGTASQRLMDAIYESLDEPDANVHQWNLKRIHEAEVHFRQSVRHEGLDDMFNQPLTETPFATLG